MTARLKRCPDANLPVDEVAASAKSGHISGNAEKLARHETRGAESHVCENQANVGPPRNFQPSGWPSFALFAKLGNPAVQICRLLSKTLSNRLRP